MVASMPDRPVHAISGTVDARVETVWQALLAVVPELQPGAAIPGVHTDVDPARHEVAQQGQWWYRGVVRVAPAARSGASEITRAIYNVAPGLSRWLVPFVHRHDARAMRAAHEALLRAVAQRIGCGYTVGGS
jgi:hypothetical protein